MNLNIIHGIPKELDSNSLYNKMIERRLRGVSMLDEFSILMTPFNTERTIRVYFPKNYYKSKANYPVLYIHDGKNVFRDEVAIGGVSLGLESYLEQIDWNKRSW